MSRKTIDLTLTALLAALICVLGPFALPLPMSQVPVSLTTIGIYLAVYVAGKVRATLAVFLYLLLGFVGMPVFSGFSGGPSKLLGPTGGYLVGFLAMAWICGCFVDRWWKRRVISAFGMLLGTFVAYVCGTLWLAYEAHMTAAQAVVAGVLPYIGFDLLKIVLLAVVGPYVKRALIRADLIEP